MCNLYSMTRSREAVLRLFLIADNRAGEIKPQSSIFPAYTAPVVRKATDGERELVPSRGDSCCCSSDHNIRKPAATVAMRTEQT